MGTEMHFRPEILSAFGSAGNRFTIVNRHHRGGLTQGSGVIVPVPVRPPPSRRKTLMGHRGDSTHKRRAKMILPEKGSVEMHMNRRFTTGP